MTDENFTTSTPGRCVICGAETDQVEVNFEAHVHPGACELRLWADYYNATRDLSEFEGGEVVTDRRA